MRDLRYVDEYLNRVQGKEMSLDDDDNQRNKTLSGSTRFCRLLSLKSLKSVIWRKIALLNKSHFFKMKYCGDFREFFGATEL